MSSWAERLETAVARWRQGDRDGAAVALREIVVAADGAVVAEASHVLGLLLAETGDEDGARAAHRSVLAGGHPQWAQRSAIVLGTLLMDEGAEALAWRPLRIAASGADPQLAGMAELSLAHVLRDLGAPEAAERARRRALDAGAPGITELAEETGEILAPDDRDERDRAAWEAFGAAEAILDADGADGGDEPETLGAVLTALNAMLSAGVPELCTRAATRLYGVYAARREFGECRRVMEHAIAVGDPAERGRAENLLGAALLDLGERAEARDAHRRAAEDHRPEVRLDALIQESKLTREFGDEEEARRILWRVVDSGHPRYAIEARACLGQVLTEAGEVEDAVECWRIVLASESEFHLSVVHFLGTLLHGLPDGDPWRAEIVELLGRAADLDDPDVSFQARLVITQAGVAERGPDEELERAVDDCDAALERLRAGDVGTARTLLRGVVDAGLGDQSAQAAITLATLELGEGDAEQADELLEHVAESADPATGFAAAVQRHLIGLRDGGHPHPALTARIDYQRLGREIGIARYEEAARRSDPAVAAPAKSALAQVHVWLGVPLSRVAELLDEAASDGDPLALSHAAVLSWLLRPEDDADKVAALLRRAHADGEPELAPWVAHALGAAVEQRAPDEALSAYESVSASGHPVLAVQAEAAMIGILEERGDLAGSAAVHERIVARGGDRAARHAWLLGFTRVRMRDLGAARAAFGAVPEDDPDLAADGRFARRVLDREFSSAVDALGGVGEPGRPLAGALLIETAHAWQGDGELEAAEAVLSLAVEHGQADSAQRAAFFLGALRADAGDRDGAAGAWAVAAAGEDPYVASRGALRLGRVRADLGDLDGAATAHRRALEAADPDDSAYAEILQDAVKALLAAGRTAEARDLQAEVSGEGPHADVLVGLALSELGDHDAATPWFETAIACGAEDGFGAEAVARASVLLARIVAARGDAAEAVRLVRRALVLFDRRRQEGDPDAEWLAGEAAWDLGEYLTATGDEEGAREAYERAAAGGPGLAAARARERLGVATLRERAVLAAEDGDRPRAVGLLTEEHGEPLLAELHLALYEEDDEAARALLRRAAGTGHAQAADMVASAAVQRLRRGMDGARDLYEAVLECGPPEQVAVMCGSFGDEYEDQGDVIAAIETLERGAAVDHPAAFGCLRRLVQTLESLDGHPALEPAAHRAAESGDPETVGVGAWALADLLKARGDHSGALPWYRTALANAYPEGVPRIRFDLGVTLFELGEFQAAYEEMEAALASDNRLIALLAGVRLGFWLADDGSFARATEAFGAAAAAGYRCPDGGEQRDALQQEALNKLGALAARADDDGDTAMAVRALWLAAAGGAHADAVEIAERYAAAADERGDRAAARAYRNGAAAFPVDGPPGSPAAQAADRALHAFGSGDHETAMRRFAEAAGAGEGARVLSLVQRVALICIAEADVPAAHAYCEFGLGLADAPAEGLDLIRLIRDDLPAPRPELSALHTALAGKEGAAIGVLAGLRGTNHFEPACQTVVAVAKARGENDPESALALLRPVAEMAPPAQAVRAWTELASMAGDPDEAVQAYERAAAVDHPAAHEALRRLAQTLFEQDRPAEAEAAAHRAVATGDPLTMSKGHRMLGLVREKRDDLNGALREIRQAIEAAEGIDRPDLIFDLRLDIARIFQRHGDAEAAAAEAGVVLAEAGTDRLRAKAGTYLANIAVLGGDLATGAEAFARVAAMRADDDAVADMADAAAGNLLGIANSAYADGLHDLAVRALTLAAGTSKADLVFGVVEARATELAEAGDHAAALRYIEAGLSFAREPDQEVELAELYAKAGEPDRAREVYERLAAHPDESVRSLAHGRLRGSGGEAPSDPGSLWVRGDDLVDAGRHDEAREILAPLARDESAIARHARVSLGRTYHAEDPARARELYLSAFEGPGEQSALATELAKMYLGSLAKARHDWPEALRWYQAVIDSGRAQNGPMAAAHLGELAYWLGDRDSAVRFYELCLAIGTEDAELVGESAYRAGEIRFAQGDLAGAAALLGRALESGHEGFADEARVLLTKLNG